MTTYELHVGARVPAQVDFWEDEAKVRAYIGGLGSGKTFAGAVAILQEPAGTTGMVVAPTYPMLRDAAQQTFFEICPASAVRSHNKSEGKTVLANGTTILWRSCDRPDSLRGPNLHWAWGDEWAYATEDAHKVVIGRLRRGRGRFWMTTTPNGQNWLHRWAVLRDLGYSVHHGTTAQNLYLPPEYVVGLRAAYADDPLFAAQELDGRFVDLSGSKRLPSLLVEAVRAKRSTVGACAVTVKGDRGSYSADAARIYALPRRGRRCVIAGDPAEGVRGGDDSAVVVLDAVTAETLAVLAGEYEPTDVFPGHIAALAQWYGASVMIERNNHGHAVIGRLRQHGVLLLAGDDGKLGWRTTTPSKAEMYRAAHAALLDAKQAGRIIIVDDHLADQIKGIERATLKGPGKGRLTKVDDEATAWALACIAAERMRAGGMSVPDIDFIPNIFQPPTAW